MKKLNKNRAYSLKNLDRQQLIKFCDLVVKQPCSAVLYEKDCRTLEMRDEEFVLWRDGMWIVTNNIRGELVTYTSLLFEENEPLEIKYISLYKKLLRVFVEKQIPNKLIKRYFTSDCTELQHFIVENFRKEWSDLTGIGVIGGCRRLLIETVDNGNLKHYENKI